jgi:hypothetical protein
MRNFHKACPGGKNQVHGVRSLLESKIDGESDSQYRMCKITPENGLAVNFSVLLGGRQAVPGVSRVSIGICSIPSDSIPIRSWPLFQAERILGSMIESHEDKESKP